jgi:RNA polymerase sigma-70 factor (ECF subfamily)
MAQAGDELEAQLIERVARGDARAFEVLFRRYHPRLVAFFRGRTHDPHAAEELVQETMMVVWQRAARFSGTCRPSTWILGIGYRKFLEWQRAARKTRLSSAQRSQSSSEEAVDQEEAIDASADLDQHVRREMLIERVHEALRELPEDHRAVLELAFQQGLSYGEIAQVLDIPPGTVKSRMFHARRKLKEILEQKGKGDALWRIVRG